MDESVECHGCFVDCKIGVHRQRKCTAEEKAAIYNKLSPSSQAMVNQADIVDRAGEGADRLQLGFDSLSNEDEKTQRWLWDAEDEQLLEMVTCRAIMRVTEIDPKLGTFRVRMKCQWAFRTLNSQEDTEVVLRGVPGIRMPSLMVTVEESRVWKDLSRRSAHSVDSGPGSSTEVEYERKTTPKTVYWKGLSTFNIGGFKAYQMQTFPYDRQVLNLEQLDFVWRPDKDSDDFYKSMRVVQFTVASCVSMLPEWQCLPPIILPLEQREVKSRGSSGETASTSATYASRFKVHLRIERKHWFYVRQVFFTTYLILLVSCTPLLMPTTEDLGNRMVMYGGGLLTLVAFKYGIAEHLPSVPYATFADDFLMYGLLTLFLCSLETVLAYRVIQWSVEDDGGSSMQSALDAWDRVENAGFVIVLLIWSAYTIHASFLRPTHRTSWRETSLQAEDDNPDSLLMQHDVVTERIDQI